MLRFFLKCCLFEGIMEGDTSSLSVLRKSTVLFSATCKAQDSGFYTLHFPCDITSWIFFVFLTWKRIGGQIGEVVGEFTVYNRLQLL